MKGSFSGFLTPVGRDGRPICEDLLEAARIGPAASRAEGFRLAALSSVAAAPLRLPPPPCQTRPSPRSLIRAPYLRGLLLALCPIPLKSGHRFVLGHSDDGLFGEPDAVDEQVHHIGGQRFARRLRNCFLFLEHCCSNRI